MRFPLSLLLLVSFAFSSLLPTSSQAQAKVDPPADWFPFTIPALDDSPSALDLSYLNEIPAGKDGFIKVDGEQLLDGKGKAWRYFGFNLVADACFPEAEMATKLAAHFAKSGVNLIRF